jgi:predicted nucleic acid-binding protein
MNDRPFLDTNILVYAFSAGDPRCERAEALLAQGGIVSVQVLNEFVNVARTKLKRDWPEIESALAVIETLLGPARPLLPETHRAAVAIAKRHRLGMYDSLILASAKEAGCDVLLSEDMGHGHRLAGVAIVDPFHDAL